MCQLLGMNCATPTDFSFSLRGFVKRGGDTDIHSHGWGMVVYQGGEGAIRCFHDTLPACISPIAELVQKYPMQTHVRCGCFFWFGWNIRCHCMQFTHVNFNIVFVLVGVEHVGTYPIRDSG